MPSDLQGYSPVIDQLNYQDTYEIHNPHNQGYQLDLN